MADVWPVAVLVGLVVGSWVNVIAARWSTDKGLTPTGRSRCPHCKRVLRWFELIPVISYLSQFGRCRRCQQRLAVRYLIVELVTASMFGLIAWQFGATLQTVVLLGLATVLLATVLVDLEHLLLPDALTWIALGLTLLGLVVTSGPNLGHLSDSMVWNEWWGGALLNLVVIGGLYLGTGGRGMGFGDVKLAPVLGMSLGGVGALAGLFLAFVIGALVGLMALSAGRSRLGQPIPFGPFLVLGWLLVLIWGPDIVTWYTGLL